MCMSRLSYQGVTACKHDHGSNLNLRMRLHEVQVLVWTISDLVIMVCVLGVAASGCRSCVCEKYCVRSVFLLVLGSVTL